METTVSVFKYIFYLKGDKRRKAMSWGFTKDEALQNISFLNVGEVSSFEKLDKIIVIEEQKYINDCRKQVI
jgi:hypothetical protein